MGALLFIQHPVIARFWFWGLGFRALVCQYSTRMESDQDKIAVSVQVSMPTASIYPSFLRFHSLPLHVIPFIHASIHPFIHRSVVHPSIRSSVHPSIRPSVHPSIYPSIYPSIHPSMQATCAQTCIQTNTCRQTRCCESNKGSEQTIVSIEATTYLKD